MRILLADDDAARAGALTKILSADPSLTILRPRPGELLADAVAALAPGPRPLHWAGCERQCGAPAGAVVRTATAEGYR
ncbi:MAG: hypothetical protein QOI29_1896 [Mycobacterium sp.]|nr:hypothetical protein [Mycobacterium sp.]